MLPTAVRLERASLPPALRSEIARLSGPQPAAFTFQLALSWLVIGVAIAAAEWVGTWWATALAIVIVATRQGVLFLLSHEQVHLLAYPKGSGDLLVNLGCAYPLLFLTTEGYAQVHLAHHRHFFTEKDPDHLRKRGAEWTYPKPLREVLRLALRDVSGLNFLRLIRGKRAPAVQFDRPGRIPRWVRPTYYLLLAAALTATGGWRLFLVYWLLPMMTVLQLVVRWGALCEHEYNRPGASVADATPLIEPPWWQRALLPNLNFNMHVYHHVFPGIAFNNLPRVHALFRAHGLVDEAAVFKGYGAYWRHLQGRAPRS